MVTCSKLSLKPCLNENPLMSSADFSFDIENYIVLGASAKIMLNLSESDSHMTRKSIAFVVNCFHLILDANSDTTFYPLGDLTNENYDLRGEVSGIVIDPCTLMK
jgi:hypothetical protein